jgi:AraC family transcriptional activator of pobA
MPKSLQIPTLEAANMDKFHFGNIEWRFSKQHHLFHINRIKDTKSKLTFPLPPHRKTVHDLLFLTNGSSVRSKGLNQYTFSKNQFFFLPALQITAHESMSEDIEGFFLHFSPQLFEDMLFLLKQFPFLQFDTTPIITIPENKTHSILNILERLLELYENPKKEEKGLIIWYLMALLTEAKQYSTIDVTNTKNSAIILTQQYKNALIQHIYNYNTVKDFAKLLHVTPNHLNKCVKQTLNKNAQTLLNEMLILEAKSLLKYSDLTISEIAENLFRRTPSNFARFFKNQTGFTPKTYQKS